MTTKTTGSGAAATDVSFEELYREHSAAMYRVAVAIVRDHALAEDVVQEALIKAWRNLDSFRGESSWRTWLLRITHNTAVSLLRKLRDVAFDPIDLPDQPTDASDSAVDAAFMRDFTAALYELDELSRSIVTLREIEHAAYGSIADVVGVSESVVKSRLFRARRHLAESLSDWRGE